MKKIYSLNIKSITNALVILILTSVVFSNLSAQKKDFQFKQGSIYKSGDDIKNFLGTYGGNTFIVKESNDNYIIEKFNQSMSMIESKEVVLEINGDEMDKVSILMMNETIYVFGKKNESKVEKQILYVATLDVNNLSKALKWKKIAESKYIDDDYQGDFFIKASDNKKFILIMANHMVKEDIIKHLNVTVLDDKLESQFSGMFETPFNFDEVGDIVSKRGISSKYISISNDGEIYITSFLLRDELSSKDIKKGKVQTKLKSGFYLFNFNTEEKTIRATEVKLEGDKILNAKMTFDKDNNILIAGFYSKTSGYKMNGAYYIRIDKTDNQILQIEESEFTNEFILNGDEPSKNDTKTIKEDGQLSEAPCELRDIHITPNGNIIVVGEYFGTYYIRSGNSTTTYYVFGDVFVVQFDEKNKTNNTTRIMKKSDTTKYYPFGCSSVYINDNLYVFFNDNIKNDNLKNPKDNSVVGYFSKLSTVMVKVDSEGDISRFKLSDNDANKTMMQPYYTYTTENQVFLYYVDGKEKNLASINFKTK